MSESAIRKLAIERYVAGELAGPAARELEEHLNTCPDCGAYLARLSSEKKEFLRIHPFAQFSGARLNAVEPWYERFLGLVSRPRLRPVFIPLGALLLIAVMLPFAGKTGVFDWRNQPELRSKGPSTPLSYIYKRGGVIHQSAPGDLFRAGDRIMLSYASSREQHLTLVSIDRTGTVSFYHPDTHTGVCSIRSGTGSRLTYPASIELDTSGGTELVAAIFSEKPFDTNQIKAWVGRFEKAKGDMAALERELKNNPPRSGSSVQTLLLKKG